MAHQKSLRLLGVNLVQFFPQIDVTWCRLAIRKNRRRENWDNCKYIIHLRNRIKGFTSPNLFGYASVACFFFDELGVAKTLRSSKFPEINMTFILSSSQLGDVFTFTRSSSASISVRTAGFAVICAPSCFGASSTSTRNFLTQIRKVIAISR